MYVFRMPVTGRVACPECGKHVAGSKLARHRKTHTNGTLYCTDCNFHTKSQADLNYHIARKHNPGGDNTFECAICHQTFNSYYPLQQHKATEHATTSRVQTNEVSVAVYVINLSVKRACNMIYFILGICGL